jgi:hypothetical protein
MRADWVLQTNGRYMDHTNGWYSPILQVVGYIDTVIWDELPVLPDGLPCVGLADSVDQFKRDVLPLIDRAPQMLLLAVSRYFTRGVIVNQYRHDATVETVPYLGVLKLRASFLRDETHLPDPVIFKIWERR